MNGPITRKPRPFKKKGFHIAAPLHYRKTRKASPSSYDAHTTRLHPKPPQTLPYLPTHIIHIREQKVQQTTVTILKTPIALLLRIANASIGYIVAVRGPVILVVLRAVFCFSAVVVVGIALGVCGEGLVIAFFTEREADEAGGEEGEEGGELHCRGAVVVSWDCKRKNFLQMVERELRVEGKKDCDEA